MPYGTTLLGLGSVDVVSGAAMLRGGRLAGMGKTSSEQTQILGLTELTIHVYLETNLTHDAHASYILITIQLSIILEPKLAKYMNYCTFKTL